MKTTKATVIATIGPASATFDTIFSMAKAGMDAARLNFAWGTLEEKERFIQTIKRASDASGKKIAVIADLPGPRIQGKVGHTYAHGKSALTPEDRKFIAFAARHGVDYVGLSFTGTAEDVNECRQAILGAKGKQKIIAKIERTEALANIDGIIEAADAIMVARGDLGDEVPLERLPYIQADLVKRANKAEKPVIVATEMLLSMVEAPRPSRAEVTDVANAILQGADGVMLSEETARGKHPVEAVRMMEKVALEAEKHLSGEKRFHKL